MDRCERLEDALRLSPRPFMDDPGGLNRRPFEVRYDEWWHDHVEPLLGPAEGVTYQGHAMYDGTWLSFRDFERMLLALGASGSDVQRLWPEA